MYSLIKIISIIIRQFCVPNPFETLGDGIVMNLWGTSMLISPEVLNWVVEPFMYAVTFSIVGIYYDEGTVPVFGSFLYLAFYCIHIFLLWVMSLAGFATGAVLLVIVMYIGCHVGANRLRNRYI
ncbi:MAG: hypothetical protein IJD58_04265 [Lachnospiraceae bacterium]|nr:hypothetical protein [Lachnospiraceae bacterium]